MDVAFTIPDSLIEFIMIVVSMLNIAIGGAIVGSNLDSFIRREYDAVEFMILSLFGILLIVSGIFILLNI